MVIMPLHKPWSRHNIPWVTLLLVLINVVVYVGYQRKDDDLVENAVRYYVDSGLGTLEAQAHARYLERTADARLRTARQARLEALPAPQRVAYLAHLTLHDVAFGQALREGTLFKDDEQRREWRGLRAPYDARLARVFTLRHLQRSSEWSPQRMLSATFLHANADHLFGNMVFLLALGTLLEGAIGSGWFLLLYLLGGFGASAASLWWRWGEPGGGLGASGAIAALMGAFCVVWGRRRVRFFYWFFVVFNYVRGPAILLLPLWLGWELYSLLGSGSEGVAFEAHAGGLVSGALLGAVLVAVRQTRPAFMDEQDAAQRDDRWERAQRHLGRMENQEAERLLAELAGESPQSLEIALARYRVARNAGRQQEAVRHAHMLMCLPTHTAEQTRLQLGVAAELGKDRAELELPARLALVDACLRNGLLADAERLLKECDSTAPRAELAQRWFVLALRHGELQAGEQRARLLRLVLEQFPEQGQASKARFLLENG
ncbi:rhomboid family intramembrane serine protease [Xanthomonas campestris pv. badrii]|uniref:Rhomboid family intramembrane serine protease n=1 Tax=Xanthomonas campestris pv. badrii TaxID=149696 RepID=A0A7Z2ZHF1_XANCA|nr:rhomboid family intramembrane serine protease [Xanthomonas campestris]QJD68206.1 rhomboid family intramembrane serine protease [Xanthomonas campestris pv. badrii]